MNQCWFNAGPQSHTVVQLTTNSGWTCLVCWAVKHSSWYRIRVIGGNVFMATIEALPWSNTVFVITAITRVFVREQVYLIKHLLTRIGTQTKYRFDLWQLRILCRASLLVVITVPFQKAIILYRNYFETRIVNMDVRFRKSLICSEKVNVSCWHSKDVWLNVNHCSTSLLTASAAYIRFYIFY